MPAKSKTDNFKVQPTTPTFCLTIVKEFPDGFGGWEPAEGWLMYVTDTLGATNEYYTNELGLVSVCGLPSGQYTVTEDLPLFFDVIGLIVNGTEYPADTTFSFTWDPAKPAPVIVFRNQTGGIIGHLDLGTPQV